MSLTTCDCGRDRDCDGDCHCDCDCNEDRDRACRIDDTRSLPSNDHCPEPSVTIHGQRGIGWRRGWGRGQDREQEETREQERWGCGHLRPWP